MDECRINKFIASCGICSRRDADKLISDGRVTVDGVRAQAGMKICDGNIVAVDGNIISKTERKTVIAYYKPVGVTCTERDEHAERTVTEEVKSDVRVTYAGRLDKDSEGLLIMTDDGLLIHEMMSGGNNHEKEYKVKVDHNILNEDIIKLRKGIYIHELDLTTRPCDIEIISPKIIKIVLTQGVNRQIRRMLHECGYCVENLCRTRIMNVKLAKMVPGEQRVVIGSELEELYRECGLQG